MSQYLTCNVCENTSPASGCEAAVVRSNVRKFRDETFELWRCPGCRSIHATHEVDLPHYYSAYPKYPPEIEPRLSGAYRGMLDRLLEGGLQKQHRILDYGCGGGVLVRFLRAHGYAQTYGYDPYTPEFSDRKVLDERYDCVISQDVIEHVDSPIELLRTLDRLAVPGGLVSIGTPDAEAIDLADPEGFVHALHAPYHRHILTHDKLQGLAQSVGWRVVNYYSTMYGNRMIPGENTRCGMHYLRCHDNCVDLLMEPVRLNSWRLLLSPETPFFFLFGYFFDRHTDIAFTFRTRDA